MRRITVSTLILLVCLTSWHTTSQPAFANSNTQTTPPTYAHSWYITNPSDSGMQHLGQKDATWTNQHCGSGLVVLAFGQPTYANGSYGVYDHGPGSPFVSNAHLKNRMLLPLHLTQLAPRTARAVPTSRRW